MNETTSKAFDLVAVGGWTIFDHIFRVERIPQVGETVTISSPLEEIDRIFWGGCAPNNAVAAARLGFSSALIMVAGRDFDERGYRRYLEETGVDLQGVHVVSDGLSGHSFLFCDPEGSSVCISHIGVSERQEDIAPDPRPLRQARAAILNDRFDRFTLAAGTMGRAAEARIVTSGDLNTSRIPQQFVAITDVLIANEFELERLAEKLDGRGIRGLLDLGPRAIVVTAGARGAAVVTSEGEEFVPAAKARQVVDPIGAGDAFAGVTAAAYGRGIPLSVAVRIGNVTASFVVEARGCQTNLPTWDLMAERYHETFREEPPAPTLLAAQNTLPA